jgi:hypothetical protein
MTRGRPKVFTYDDALKEGSKQRFKKKVVSNADESSGT